MISEDIKREAIALVNDERAAWEDSLCQVTDTVSMEFRDAIKQFRKNYFGVFDVYDENKVWVPVTEQSVEDTLKQYDIDQKDMRFRAKTKAAIPTTDVIRAITHDKLDKKFFGEYIDRMERSLGIDGTAVWKTYEGTNKEGKKDLIIKQVDLLNFYIDPSAESIYETEAVIERIVMPTDQFKRQKGFVDTDDIKGETNVPVFERDGVVQHTGRTKMVEAYERWGLAPKYFVTGNKKDTELVETRIVTSGKGDASRVHFIGKSTLKPYEEAWYTRVPGRWYGRGVAEKLLMLQMWANMVKNIHITRQTVSQLGLWKVKQNSGITPQMLKKLNVNGAITVKNMDDIEQLVMQEASPASYRDMDDIQKWTQKITSAVESISPESLSSTATATTSVINDRNNKSTFTMIREGIGMFFQRWMDRHALPIILNLYTVGDMIRVTGDDEAVRGMVNRVVANNALKALAKARGKGYVPTKQEMEIAMNKAQQEMIQSGDILVELKKKYKNGEVESKFFVTNEEFDTAVTVQNILGMLPIAPEYKGSMVKTVFGLMGLPQPTAEALPQEQLGEAGQAMQPKKQTTKSGIQQAMNAVSGATQGKSLAGQV